MSEIFAPFPQFTDEDGNPLDDGYVYIGTVGLDAQTNQIPAFWDSALTQPAAQPLRTSGGYIMYQGAPSDVFVSAVSWSIKVLDKHRRLVFENRYNYAPDGSNIGFIQAGTGAVPRTAQDKMREIVSVLDFYANGVSGPPVDPTGVIDSALGVQAAINTAILKGGSVIFPPGKYLFGSQVLIDRSGLSTERNLIISGYGAEIRTTGAISAFQVKGGVVPYHTCRVEGFTIYHKGNTTATAGIALLGAVLTQCYDITVIVSSSLPAGYAAFSLSNITAADPDTGSFWCTIENCSVRPLSGADGYATYGVNAVGAANALTLRNNMFSGANTHVALQAHAGQTYSPNSVNIDGNFFEGPSTSTAISLIGAAPIYHVSGVRITNNRFEALNTAVSLTGTGNTVQVPVYMAGNYADTSITNYIVNASNIPINMMDIALVGAALGPTLHWSQRGLVVRNLDATYDALTAKVQNQSSGFKLQRFDDVDLGTWRYKSFAGGVGSVIGGTSSPYRPFGLVGCAGIAVKDTPANNLAGVSSFSAATTRVVSFPVAEADANYLIFLEARADQKLWVTGKTTGGFTVNSDVSSSNGFGWLLIRHL